MTRVMRTATLAAAALVVAVMPSPASATPVAPSTPSSAPSPSSPAALTSVMTPLGAADVASLSRSLPARAQPPVRRLIVRTTTGRVAGPAITSAARSLARVSGATFVRRLASGSSLLALSTPVSLDEAWRIARSLTARGDVVYAEPDLLMQASGSPSPVTPADPGFSRQWDLWDSTAASGGWSSKAPAAWSRTRGRSEIVVAVLDTGITAHPELAGQTVPGYDFVSGDGSGGTAPYYTANDGTGRDPDPSDPGDWISAAEAAGSAADGFFANEGCTADSSSWHGTHVAGTIVAKQDNGIGISGMAPGVKVQALRVLGKCGGYVSDIADAIRWASGADIGSGPGNPATANPTPASVINLSLGGPGPCDAETQSAITTAVTRGTTVVVAAGNDSTSIISTTSSNGSNPADCTGVVDVVATDRSGSIAGYSDYGVVPGSTVIAAPGGADTGAGDDILSTVNRGTTSPTSPGYAWYAGTSMATPHVAAAAALLQSLRVGRTPYTPAEVAALLSDLTHPFTSSSGCSLATCGTGVLDLAVPLPTFVPLSPDALVTQPADHAVTLSWTPGDTGGNDVTYAVELSTDGTSWAAASSTTHSSLQISGLTDGTDYWFRVIATTVGNGSSAASVTGPVRPSAHARPQWPAPASVSGGVERLAIAWAAPSDGGDPITHYSVEYRLVGGPTWTCAVPTTPPDSDCLVPASTTTATVGWPRVLAPGRYEVRVAAKNSNGLGVYAPVSFADVASLHQTTTVSGSTLRPLRDGYQDSVRVAASSNIRSGGSIRILDMRGHLVRSVALTTGTGWGFTWTGLDSRNRRVANGRYHVQVLLRGRTAAPVVISTSSVLVASSRASRPAVQLSTSTLYPHRDRYLDTLSIRVSASVPATFTMTIVGPRGTVWSTTIRHRGVARATWDGTGRDRRTVAAGTYRLVVTAKGGEGAATSTTRTITVSGARVRANTFDFVVSAAAADTMLLSGSISPYGADGIRLEAPATVVGVSLTLPASVRPYADILLITCTDIDNPSTARARFAFLDETASIADGPWGIPNSHGCYVTPAAAPAPSLFSGQVHFAVANVPVAPADPGWVVSAYEVTGTSYYLR